MGSGADGRKVRTIFENQEVRWDEIKKGDCEMSANDEQVGGNHYKGQKSEHWDIVIDHKLDYFQAQILRYTMRWNKKDGIKDLRKAEHFIKKYIEAINEGRIEDPTVKSPQQLHEEAMTKQFGPIAPKTLASTI